MAASPKIPEIITGIVLGHGPVTLKEALVASVGAASLVGYLIKIKVWPMFNDEEQVEIRAIEADAPAGWWLYLIRNLPPALFKGTTVRWVHGKYTGTGYNPVTKTFDIVTPKLVAGELV